MPLWVNYQIRVTTRVEIVADGPETPVGDYTVVTDGAATSNNGIGTGLVGAVGATVDRSRVKVIKMAEAVRDIEKERLK